MDVYGFMRFVLQKVIPSAKKRKSAKRQHKLKLCINASLYDCFQPAHSCLLNVDSDSSDPDL